MSLLLAAQAGAVKPRGAGGGFAYYPPIYAIRTKGSQSAPAPRQKARAKVGQVAEGVQSAPAPRQGAKARYIKKVAFCSGNSYVLAPTQGGQVWPHRLKNVRDEEERKIILMLLGFDIEGYELHQAGADSPD